MVADNARDIRNAVDFCAKQNLKMILASGAESWKVKDLLKEKKIPVILGPTRAAPRTRGRSVRQANDPAGRIKRSWNSICVFEFWHIFLAQASAVCWDGGGLWFTA